MGAVLIVVYDQRNKLLNDRIISRLGQWFSTIFHSQTPLQISKISSDPFITPFCSLHQVTIRILKHAFFH